MNYFRKLGINGTIGLVMALLGIVFAFAGLIYILITLKF